MTDTGSSRGSSEDDEEDRPGRRRRRGPFSRAAEPAEPAGSAGRRRRGEAKRDEPAPKVVVRPLAPPARRRPRHWGLLAAFVALVVLPAVAAFWYLQARAADQYASTLGFTVRSEDISSATDILGGLGTALGSGGGHESDILYEFIQSQEIVAAIDAELDLRGLYSQHHETDPLLTFDPSGTIEDLTDYWQRMVRIAYDSGTGLIELTVLAFGPEEARTIAGEIYDQSSRRINALSSLAREDALRYAREDLDLALERLKAAREALTAFRLANQIVDPAADIQGQVGLLSTLQAQLAEALIEYDLLSGTARDDDPRVAQGQRRIDVIRARIAEERQKFGAGGSAPGGESYADTVAAFESLSVDQEFAEQAYLAALAAYDAARAEADRQSKYLAAYIEPTLAQRSDYPRAWLIVGLTALFGFLAWAVLSLVYYSLRDAK